MRRRRGNRVSNFTAGVVVLVLVAVGTYLGFRKEIPFEHHYVIRGAFKTSNGLRLNSPVRIAGVNIGKVTKIEPVDGRRAALVTMRIDKRGLPIHRDAHLAVRPRIFLEGNFFVDVQPGSPSAPVIDDGDTIPVNQTSTPVQLDQILTSLQSDTRHQLQVVLGSLSKGLSGKGAAGYNASIPYWTPAYRDSAVVSDATRGLLEHDLSDYIRDAGTTAEALDRNSVQLKSLVSDFDTTAGAFAAREAELRSAVGELPRTLRAAMPALAAVNRALPPTRRLIADLRPAARSSVPALDAAIPLARQLRALVSKPELRGLVADLVPTVPSLAALNRATVPLLQQTRLASSCQNEVILPWSKQTIDDPVFPATGPVYQDSVKVLPGLAGESRAGDANGQWFRVLVSGGLYSIPNGVGGVMLTDRPLLGVNPPAAARPPLRSNVPCETQEVPDLRTQTGAVPAAHRAEIPASRLDDFKKMIAKDSDELSKLISTEGLSSQLKVSDTPADASDLALLKQIKLRMARSAP